MWLCLFIRWIICTYRYYILQPMTSGVKDDFHQSLGFILNRDFVQGVECNLLYSIYSMIKSLVPINLWWSKAYNSQWILEFFGLSLFGLFQDIIRYFFQKPRPVTCWWTKLEPYLISVLQCFFSNWMTLNTGYSKIYIPTTLAK